MTSPLLRVEDLHTWIDTGDTIVRAVDGISFDIAPGETLALLGESGCGKSMTALSIMRLLPDAGRIVGGSVALGGEELLRLPESRMREVRGRRIAMIFQEPMLSLNPVMTCGAQIAETLRAHTALEGAALDARVLELLDAVGIPDAKRRRTEYPFQLSGGMKQRVMIATALACDPELLIADEPTTALDVTIQAQVLALLRELQGRRRMSMLLITHDLAVVAEMAQRVAVMYAGEIVETAGRDAFFAHPAHPYSRKLFASLPAKGKRDTGLAVIRGSVPPLTREFTACRFAERCDYAWERGRCEVPGWYRAADDQYVRCFLFDPAENRAPWAHPPGGRRSPGAAANLAGTDADSGGTAHELRVADHGSRAASHESRRTDRESLLAVTNLKVHFPIHKGLFKRVTGHVKAVDGVSLSIAPGRTLGLVGESGCGKTTVGKSLLRLIEPTAGKIMFAGEDLLALSQAELRARRRHAQIIFQDPYSSLNPRTRIAETIEEGMAALGIGESRRERLARIDALLGEVGLAPEVKFRYPHEFSGGQRQRIAIARALAVEPRLIVCDEPTSALDVSVQAQILNLLKQLQQKKGLSYLFITHNIGVIEFIAHEIAVMYLGRIVEHGTVEDVLEHARHPYTRALLSAVPTIDKETKRPVIRLAGDLPSPVNPPPGCHFNPRCPDAMPECREEYPADARFSSTHTARCHLYSERAQNGKKARELS